MTLDWTHPSTAEQSHVEGREMTAGDLTTKGVERKLKAVGIRGGSRPTIIRWSDKGWIPHYKTFSNYRYYRPEVIALLIQLWREGNRQDTDGANWVESISERLWQLHNQLAERDRIRYESEAKSEAEAAAEA